MWKGEEEKTSKENYLIDSFKFFSVYDVIILQIQHAHYVLNLMNKKGSPSHIILNYNGNYTGNKNSKISREREKIGKKVRIQGVGNRMASDLSTATSESGHQ